MKTRRSFLLAMVLLLLLSVPMAAFAASDDSDAQLRYVTDASNLLTDDQESALESRAQEISQEYSFSIYIIALDDYRVYSTKSDFWDASVEIYDNYQLGWGEEKAGAFLMLSMQERDFCLHFNSDRANYAFTEAGRDKIEDRVVPYLKENDYYGGFNEYLNCCQEYLEAAKNGTPIGEGQQSRNESKDGVDIFVDILFFCLPGLFAAAVTAVVLIVPMRSSGVKNQADDYVVPGSMRLNRQSDHFLRRTVTRTPRQKENHSSSGGSISTSHSTGSHSGRTGKF